jgi:hypothetical protein
MLQAANLVGSVVAIAYYGTCILVFVSRLVARPRWGQWIGCAQGLVVVPLAWLLAVAPRLSRPPLYYVQVGLLLAFVILEFLLDSVLRVDFRHRRGIVIAYVVFFFAGTGGMLGVAALGGRPVLTAAGLLFLGMAALAFVQRRVTGL